MRIRWRNLFKAPMGRLRVVAEGEENVVLVDGLVCDTVCARRVKVSLAQLPGVRLVCYRPDDDSFLLSGDALRLTDEAVRDAVQRVVVMMPLRRLLAGLKEDKRRGARDARQPPG